MAKVLGNTKAAAMRYIHADEDVTNRASQGIGDVIAQLMKQCIHYRLNST